MNQFIINDTVFTKDNIDQFDKDRLNISLYNLSRVIRTMSFVQKLTTVSSTMLSMYSNDYYITIVESEDAISIKCTPTYNDQLYRINIILDEFIHKRFMCITYIYNLIDKVITNEYISNQLPVEDLNYQYHSTNVEFKRPIVETIVLDLIAHTWTYINKYRNHNKVNRILADSIHISNSDYYSKFSDNIRYGFDVLVYITKEGIEYKFEFNRDIHTFKIYLPREKDTMKRLENYLLERLDYLR